MQLVFDMADRTLVVSFRGTLRVLGPFLDQKTAVRAGEQYCRNRGWEDSESHLTPTTTSSNMS